MKLYQALLLSISTAATTGTSTGGVVSSTVSGSYTIGPTYVPDVATKACSDGECKPGTTFELFMPIKDSAFYNCEPEDNPFLSGRCADGYCGQEFGTLGTRNITVYVPAAYEDSPKDEVAVMVTQDGSVEPWNTAIKNTMDNLIGAKDAERSLPVFVLVAVDLAGPGTNGRVDGNSVPDSCASLGAERPNEYVTVSTDYARFISEEVLPFVTNHSKIKDKYPNLTFTNDPRGRASFGGSDGGGAAIKMAWFSPELFGIAIAYYAGLDDRSQNPSEANITSILDGTYPKGLGELWVPETEGGQELIKNSKLKPIRVFHSSSDKDMGTPDGCFTIDELGVIDQPASMYGLVQGSFLEGNNKTHAALTEKGYDTRYAYALNQCHTSSDSMLQDIPNTLVWAWSDWGKTDETITENKDSSSAYGLASMWWMRLSLLVVICCV